MFKLLFSAGAIALLTAVAAPAYATTIDFSTLPLYTPVTTQFPGVTFSLIGGPGPDNAPVTGSFGSYGLGNSPTGDYPTTETLNIAFASGVKNLSFTFDNFGSNSEFGPSTYSAYGKSGLISTGNIASLCCGYDPVSVFGSGITDLMIGNGSGGNYSWEFGVGQVSYTSGVPEASTWVMMLAGFAGLGFVGYRRNKVVNFAA